MKKLPFILLSFLLLVIPAPAQTKDESIFDKTSRLFIEKKFDEALSELNKAIELEPKNALLYLKRANAFIHLKNNEAAVKDVQTAFSLSPENRWILVNGEMTLRFIFKTGEIIKFFTSLIESGKAGSYAYAIRARNRQLVKDYAGSFEDIIKIIETNPVEYEDISTLFIVLNSLKDDKNVFGYYERLFEVLERQAKFVGQNPPRVYENEELNRSSTKDIIEKLNGNLRFFMIRCAVLYEEKGLNEKAKNLFIKVLAIESKPAAYANRAEVYSQSGKYKQAIKDFTRALKYQKEDTESDFSAKGNAIARILVARGSVYLLAKQFDKAIADFEASINFISKYPHIALKKIEEAKQKKMEDANRKR